MAIVAKWLTHRVVVPAFEGSIPFSRPTLGYGQVVKASDFDSDIDGSNPSSPAIFFAGVAELADALDLGSSSSECRFDSCHPHQNALKTQLKYRCVFLVVAK